MRKLACTIVFIMNEVIILCVIGAAHDVPFGDLHIIINYADLAFFLGDSTVIAAACILCSKDWE